MLRSLIRWLGVIEPPGSPFEPPRASLMFQAPGEDEAPMQPMTDEVSFPPTRDER